MVDALPQRQSQCIRLYYFEDLRQEEIAIKLDIAQQAVSRYLQLARNSLRMMVLIRDWYPDKDYWRKPRSFRKRLKRVFQNPSAPRTQKWVALAFYLASSPDPDAPLPEKFEDTA